MKKRNMLSAICLAVFTLGLAGAAFADVSLRPVVRNLIHAGTGCPAGTVELGYNRIGELEVRFDSFLIEAGRHVTLAEIRKFCQFNFQITAMRGMQLGLRLLREEGSVGLDRGVASNHRVTGYVTGSSGQLTAVETIRGPVDQEYMIDHRDENATLFFPCGVTRPVNIKLAGDLRGFGEGFDSLSKLVFEVVARRCN